MKKKSWPVCLAALAMMGLSAVLLARAQGMFRLGNPGLRVISEPIRDPDGLVVGTNRVYLPIRVMDCRSEELPVTRLELNALPQDTTFGRRRYFNPDGSWMDLGVVLMGTDRTSIHKPEYCLPGQGFVIDRKRSEVTSVEITKPHSYSLPVWKIYASKKLRDAEGREQVWSAVYVFWFVADGELTASHFERMFRMGRELILTGTLQRWAYVSCLAVCRPGEEDATFARMKPFLAAAVPEFQLTSSAASASARLQAGPGSRPQDTVALGNR